MEGRLRRTIHPCSATSPPDPSRACIRDSHKLPVLQTTGGAVGFTLRKGGGPQPLVGYGEVQPVSSVFCVTCLWIGVNCGRVGVRPLPTPADVTCNHSQTVKFRGSSLAHRASADASATCA